MSSPSLSPSSPPPSSGVGLGYGIAIAVGILVLVSTIMLASYLCVRVKGGPHTSNTPPNTTTTTVAPLPSSEVVVGLEGAVIEAYYPKFLYSEGAREGEEGPCSICLVEYVEGEALRRVPECGHWFHVECVDEWLRVSATCPLCRSSPVPSATPTPLATPLSELIPLATHPR